MIHLGGIMVFHGDWGIVTGGQQVLLDVLDLSSVVIQAVKYKADMSVIQLQQARLYHHLSEVIPGHPECLPFGADHLHYQFHHLIQLSCIPWVLPHKVVIADVLPDQLPIDAHLRFPHSTASPVLLFPSLRFHCRRPVWEMNGKG